MITLTEKEIDAILNTLENISVKGFENLDKLMALITFFRERKENNGGLPTDTDGR